MMGLFASMNELQLKNKLQLNTTGRVAASGNNCN